MSAGTKGPDAWPLGQGYADPANDQPAFDGLPASYIIAGSQRCGSTLLGDLLGRMGRLGVPAEYLNSRYLGREMSERLGHRDPRRGILVGPYLKALYRIRTSPEGWFGMKLQWHQYTMARGSEELGRLLRNSRFIFLTRDDLLGQAISGALANASGYWHERPGRQRERPQVAYQEKLVTQSLQWILWENWGWNWFFSKNGIVPLAVTYEQLVSDADGVCRRVCQHIGLPDPPRFDLQAPPTVRLADGRNAEWRQRYEAGMLGRAGS